MNKILESDLEIINKNLEAKYQVIIIMNPDQYKFQGIGSRLVSLGFEGIYKSVMAGKSILAIAEMDFIESIELDSRVSISEEE